MAKTSAKARQAKRERTRSRSMPHSERSCAKREIMRGCRSCRGTAPRPGLHSRCNVSGRPRGYMRKFGISRIAFRELALEGKDPGCPQGQLVRPSSG